MKTILIAGAAGGIGGALASLAKTRGFKVIAAARDTRVLEGKGYHLIEADFAKPPEAGRMAPETAVFAQTIDIFAYTAGDIIFAKNAEITPADWQRMFDANLHGAQNSLQACLPLLAPDAHLFFIGAYTDRLVLPGLGAYVASKAALEKYTAVLEKELRGKKVTLVRPSAVATKFWDKVPFKMPADALEPGQVAGKILKAHDQGLSCLLDL